MRSADFANGVHPDASTASELDVLVEQLLTDFTVTVPDTNVGL